MDGLGQVFAKVITYRLTYITGFILMFLFNVLIYHKVFNISRLRAAVRSVVTFAYGYLGAMLISDLYNAVASLKGLEPQINMDMIGAILFQLLWIPTVHCEKYILKLRSKATLKKHGNEVKIKTVSFRDTFDFIVPGAFIVLACIKIGCCFAGCCYGIECSWGFHASLKGTPVTLFPIQIFEFVTICLVIILSYLIKQTQFYRRGMAGPLTVAMYTFARFCWEFLRGYTPEMRHFFLGLSLWQIFCLIILIVVVAWIIVLYKTQPSEPKPKGYLFAKYDKKTVNSKGK